MESRYVSRNIEARSCNYCSCEKAISITHSKRVFVALAIQHARRMHHTVICGLFSSAKFFHVISQTALFSKKKLSNTKRLFRFPLQLLSETFLVIRRTERDMMKRVYSSSCTVPLQHLYCYSEFYPMGSIFKESFHLRFIVPVHAFKA
jgi:hypothetical protein